MKKTILKIITIIFSLASAVFMFFKWFSISVADISEAHSLVTLPNLVQDGTGFITRIGGKTVAGISLILCAVLEYLCILSAGLSAYGSIRLALGSNRTRMIFSSQVIAIILQIIVGLIMVAANIISSKIAVGLVNLMPTIWYGISALCSVTACITSMYYSKK